jgi:hypothetical protein
MVMTLAQKLNLKETELLVLNAPEGYLPTLADALPNVMLTTESDTPAGAILLFVNNLEEATRLTPDAARRVRDGGLLWVAYPKGTSKVKTDVNRDKLWPVLATMDWRPIRQVALDEVWSAMRFRPSDEVGR